MMQRPTEMETPNGSLEHGLDAVVPETDGGPNAAERSRRARARWVLGGFGAGIVLAFVIIAVRVAMVGWRILPYELIFDLIWSPILGAEMGMGLGYRRHPASREERRLWKRPRFRMLTMMILVAYVALLFGAGVSTAPIGDAARRYSQKYQTSLDLMAQFRELAKKAEAESGQLLSTAAELRSGRIPDGLHPSQKEFLKSLDRTATPEYREERYGLIADGDEQRRRGLEHAVEVLRRLIAHYEELAAKYDRARRRPWLPVEPDPPRPSTQ
jgi:hypothetical protein